MKPTVLSWRQTEITWVTKSSLRVHWEIFEQPLWSLSTTWENAFLRAQHLSSYQVKHPSRYRWSWLLLEVCISIDEKIQRCGSALGWQNKESSSVGLQKVDAKTTWKMKWASRTFCAWVPQNIGIRISDDGNWRESLEPGMRFGCDLLFFIHSTVIYTS